MNGFIYETCRDRDASQNITKIGNASRYFGVEFQFRQEPMLHAFKGWDKSFSIEKLLPKAPQHGQSLS